MWVAKQQTTIGGGPSALFLAVPSSTLHHHSTTPSTQVGDIVLTHEPLSISNESCKSASVITVSLKPVPIPVSLSSSYTEGPGQIQTKPQFST